MATQVRGDFAELFEGGFEVLDDFLGENVGIGKIVGVFEAFVSQPGDVEAGLVTVDEVFVVVGPLTPCEKTPLVSHETKPNVRSAYLKISL